MKTIKFIFIGILCLLDINILSAQQQELYSYEYFVSGTDTLHYRMLLPKDFSESKQYPVVVFLHGSGERGNDNEKQLVHGGKLFVENRDTFPAIVIFPQCPQEDYWANIEDDRTTSPISFKFPLDIPPTKALNLVIQLAEHLSIRKYVDKDRLYIGGLSMGGFGTFETLYHKPNTFAAAFTICGGGNPEATKKYAQTTPLWVFHGANDDVVNPQLSIDMVSAILNYGGKPNFSLYAKDNHNSWDSAFAEPNLLSWLFSNSKTQ